MERANGGGGGSEWNSACRSSTEACFWEVTVPGPLSTVVPWYFSPYETRCTTLDAVVDMSGRAEGLEVN